MSSTIWHLEDMMLSSTTTGKGKAGATPFVSDLYPILDNGKVAQVPYTVTLQINTA